MLLLLHCSCWSDGRRRLWETHTTLSKPGCGTAHGCTACLPQSCWQPPPWRSLQPGLLRGSSAQACLLLRLAAAGPAAQWRPSACGAWLLRLLAAGSCIAVHREFRTRQNLEAAAAAAAGGGMSAIAIEDDGGEALLSKGDVRARLKVGAAGLDWTAHHPHPAWPDLLLAWAAVLRGASLLLGWQSSLICASYLPACACRSAGVSVWPPRQPVERAGGLGRPWSICCRPSAAQARLDGCLLRPGAVLRLVYVLCRLGCLHANDASAQTEKSNSLVHKIPHLPQWPQGR